ncbi:PRP1 splicing factor-like protein [Nitzschia inconspicua]|uniref:PRP1 splicing factor-like protein n=1 Tax=Nitzschia inconspicua TaxID=303405 RepID=A0A9K3LWG8_9STRA|nr:PRP1 splicing factor-like protein [Nitzschia inconspicua]
MFRGGGGGSSGSGPPIKGYVPGLGRGASGFTTRSDIGNFVDPSSSSSLLSSSNVIGAADGTGSRAAEQRAAKMLLLQRQKQQQQQQQPSKHGNNSDVSPWGQAPTGYVAGAGRGASRMGESMEGNATGDGPQSQQQQQNYDNDDNNDTGGRGTVEGQYDDDDMEADMIWDAIDERMAQKKRKRTTPTVNQDEDAQAQTRRKIQTQFADAKQQLAQLNTDDWMNIPDVVGDLSLKHKRKQERKQQQADWSTPLTDSLLEQRSTTTTTTNLNTVHHLNATIQDTTSAGGMLSTVRNMSGLGAARGTVLGMSLDRMSDNVTGQTTVDPQGYLTSMATSTSTLASSSWSTTSNNLLAPDTNLGDVEKARLLLKSVRDTNPNHPQGWIASARVEEAAGKLLKARKLIQEGCQHCPTSTDIWLEAARLHPHQVSKSILATAVRRIPHSIPLFLKAAELESHPSAKKAVLRKAIEANPTSLTLWKAAIELEDDSENAKILLAVAVEKIPTAVELWLALARLESYQNAQKVLNQARRALPAERSIWIAASQLEESQQQQQQQQQQQHLTRVDKIMDHAFASLARHDAVVTRDQWLQDAEDSETAGAPHTATAIVTRAVGLGVDDEDKQRTWAEDAKGALSRGAVATARAIIAHALKSFPTKKGLWMQAVDLERNHGTMESLDQILEAASDRLPRVELFWLLRAKEQWLAGHTDTARDILTKAFEQNPDSESVWLAAAKLEWETGEMERARVLLQRARERAPTERVYMKSAMLEREQQHYKAALKLIEEGMIKYPKYAKLYMIAGQITSNELPGKKKSHLERARKIYQEGLEKCPSNITLWILASRLEEDAHNFVDNDDDDKNNKETKNNNNHNKAAAGAGVTKARSLLELARLKNPKNDQLWLEAIRLERRSNNPKLAETLMARALQECPKSGALLSETILTAPRVEQKSKSADAIKRNPESPLVIAAVATLFSLDRKTEKARKWFERAVMLDQDWGDSWVRYYAFELEHGTSEQQQAVKDRCVKVEPKHGELWPTVVKDMAHRHKSIGECLELAAAQINNR